MKRSNYSIRLIVGIGLLVSVLLLLMRPSPEQQETADKVPKSPAKSPVHQAENTAKNSMAQQPYQKFHTPEVEHALDNGAKGRITLKVVDSTGTPVRGADVEVYFAAGGPKNSQFKGRTDENGKITCEGLSNSFCTLYVKKIGYYMTTQQYSFMRDLSVKNGRWQPWNPTVEVVLKEKRMPAHMIVKRIDVKLPKELIAHFDCLIGDWLSPLGEGKTADMSFVYHSDSNGIFGYLTNSLTLTMGQGGIIMLKKNQFSELKSVYEAPLVQYAQEIKFEHARTPEKIIKDITLSEDEYLVFYSSVLRDKTMTETNAYFGKLTSLEYGESKKQGHGFLKFTYYLNPTPNDRNLEAEGQRP
jgi:hypothetical protein